MTRLLIRGLPSLIAVPSVLLAVSAALAAEPPLPPLPEGVEELRFSEDPGVHGERLPHTPGPLLLTGLLEVGRREEVDGRVSVARLVLDPGPPGGKPATALGPETAGR